MGWSMVGYQTLLGLRCFFFFFSTPMPSLPPPQPGVQPVVQAPAPPVLVSPPTLEPPKNDTVLPLFFPSSRPPGSTLGQSSTNTFFGPIQVTPLCKVHSHKWFYACGSTPKSLNTTER